jgi:membrane-associated phospholipid phosphatase
MTLRSILAALRSVPPPPRARTAGRRAGFCPRLEPLEDRCLLSGDVILDWNATLINTIAAQQTPLTLASRSMAMVHVAMYDAVAALEPRYAFYAVPGLDDAPPPAAHAFPEVAAAKAADAVLDSLYPAQAATFDAQLQSFLAGYPSHGRAIAASLSWGQTVANAVVTWRSTDGSDAVVPYTPGTGPGVWQPTPPAFLKALAPQWPSVTPFALAGGSQFRPPTPPALTSSDYATAFNEVKSLGRIDSATRTADQTQIALFWRDPVGAAYAFGHWNKIAEGVSVAQGLDLVDNARLFALLNIATADALIATWDAKYTYNFWRPVTAIQFAGDSSLNPATESDPTWAPLIVTPNFPSYTSAHSTVSGAAAAVLTALFGPDYSFTAGSDGLPGVTRSFPSFEAAAAEAGQSRIYGGIHFQFDNQYGLASGGALGRFVFHNFLAPVRQGDDEGGNSAVPVSLLAAPQGASADAPAPAGLRAGHAGGTALEAVALGRALVEAPAAPAASGPTLLPPQRAAALAAAPPGQDQPTRPASAPDRSVERAGHRRALARVFTGLDGDPLSDALRGDEVPAWAL